MSEAIVRSLPLAIGVALSPLSIIAMLAMLATSRARSNGPAFLLGWVLGLGAIGTVVLVLVGTGGAGAERRAAGRMTWLELVLGVVLLLVAVRFLHGRPRGGSEVPPPQWLLAFDQIGPVHALSGGAALAGANPKNLVLSAGGAALIAGTGISSGQQAIAYAVFAITGAVGVAAPVCIYFAMGHRSVEVLGRAKDWMERKHAVVIAVLCLVIAATLVRDALGELPP